MANKYELNNTLPSNFSELLQRIVTLTEPNNTQNISSQLYYNSSPQTSIEEKDNKGIKELKNKRTRRRPRIRKKKSSDEENTSTQSYSSTSSISASPTKSTRKLQQPSTSEACSSRILTEICTFAIKSVKSNTNSKFFHKRTTRKYINLKTFLNRTTASYLLESRVNERNTKTVRTRRSTEQNQKEEVFFNYLSEEEVELGLSNKTLIEGIIRVNQKNSRESYVSNEDSSRTDYLISSILDRNRALDGDEVVLKLKSEEEWTSDYKTAQVVFIKQKVHNRIAIGTLKIDGKQSDYAVFVPRDRRFPYLRIYALHWPNGFKERPQQFQNILFVAKLLEWNTTLFATGILMENLGQSGNLKVETISILREFNLDTTPFKEELTELLPDFKVIPEKEYEYREDLRKKCIFTIDPATARDLDDAVSVELLSNGNYEVGVHISDAAFYLPEGTELDQIVSKKATTIYMVDNVYHMLPQEMCLGCSLLPGEEKLSFSIIWEINPQAEIISKRFTRSIMISCVKLSYEHAQQIIDNPEKEFTTEDFPQIHNNYEPKDIVKTVNILHNLAVIMRTNRFKNGALKIDNVKLMFNLNPDSGEPLDFSVYENRTSHRLIEEFMLLANISVAEKIYQDFPDVAFLRSHEAPKQTMLASLQNRLSEYGIHLDISSAGTIASSLNKYFTPDYAGYSRAAVLNHLTSKTMTRAKYFCASTVDSEDHFKHYALSIPIYTHFTSPIRRYADIMVHRLLAASLNYQDRPHWDISYVKAIANNCNIQKYQAKKAGDASMELYLAHYVQAHKPFRQDCVVVDVKEKKFDVIVLSTGSIIRVYQQHCEKGTKWKYESNKLTISFPKSRRSKACIIVIELFTVVKLAIQRKDFYHLEGVLERPIDENRRQ